MLFRSPPAPAYAGDLAGAYIKEVKMKEPELKLRCPKCAAPPSDIRTSKVTGISWCRRCAHSGPKEEFEERVKKEV